MLPQVRLILVATLGLSVWHLVDGAYALWRGHFIARQIAGEQLFDVPGAVLLSDGRVLDYGRWAQVVTDAGMDPTWFAPFFVGLGVVGVVGLFLFLQARAIGWAMLVAFAAGCTLRLGAPAAVAAVLLLVLLLPATRRLLQPSVPVRIVDDTADPNADS